MTEPPANPPPYPGQPPAQQQPPPYQPFPGGPQPGWQPPPQRPAGTNGFAIAALVLGILGACLVAIPLAIVALVQIGKSGAKGRGMAIAGLVLSALWLVLAAVVITVEVTAQADRDDAGTIVGSGSLAPENLRVGDCLNEYDADSDAVYKVAAVPCSEQHEAEVYAVLSLDIVDFPGDGPLEEIVGDRCIDALESVSPEVFDDESYGVYWYQPSEETWEDGDRGVQCLATTEDPQTGSILD